MVTTTAGSAAAKNIDTALNTVKEGIAQVGAFVARLTSKEETLSVQHANTKAAYNRIMNANMAEEQAEAGKLTILQQAAWAIQNTSATSLYLGNTAAVTGAPTGSTVVTASASSDALAGRYDISLINSSGSTSLGLAMEHRVRSNRQLYADQALGWAGNFYTGGAAARAHTGDTTNANVTAFGVAALASGQTELGTDNYKVEARQDPNNPAWYQFRLVGSDGGPYDTGRGLTIEFAAGNYTVTSGLGAANTNCSAQGAQIAVATTDSLNDIACKINSATYSEGNAVAANLVDRQLVLAAKSTGLAHVLHAGDTTGTVLQQLGVVQEVPDGGGGFIYPFKNQVQAARNAVFMVNGLTVTRSRNTNLTDVIGGLPEKRTARGGARVT